MEKWFKLYSADYLVDSKIRCMNGNERSCLITLLCLADTSDIPGFVKHLSENDLLWMSGLDSGSEEWKKTLGVLDKFEKMGIVIRNDTNCIEVRNFRKRQGEALTAYERVKKRRAMIRNDNNVIRNDTDDNKVIRSRREKKRKEENIITTNSESTPAQDSRDFFNNPIKQEMLIGELMARDIPEAIAKREINKFVSYWTEPNKSGTKQRWELQKTFEVRRRIITWFSKINDFKKSGSVTAVI